MSETTATTDDVPEEALATVEDFTVERGSDDEVLPVTRQLPGRDEYVKVKPLTQGEANEYLPEHGDPRSLDDAALLELLTEFFVAPDFSGVDDLDALTAYSLDPLIKALMDASGFDMMVGMLGESDEMRDIVEENMNRGS